MGFLDDLDAAYQTYISPVVGAPKRVVDIASDYYSGLPQALSGTPVPTGELAKEALFPKSAAPSWVDIPAALAEAPITYAMRGAKALGVGPADPDAVSQGVARGVTGAAVDMATDPLMYTIAKAPSGVQRVAAAMFTPQMLSGAVHEAEKGGAEHNTQALLYGLAGGMGAMHAIEAPAPQMVPVDEQGLPVEKAAGVPSTPQRVPIPVDEPPAPQAPQAPKQPVVEAPPAPPVVPETPAVDAGFGTPHPETGHKYSNTQINLEGTPAGDTLSQMAGAIPDEHLQEGSRGREVRPHVTVKWGLHTDDPATLTDLLKDEPPATVTFGKTSTFPPSEGSDGADVVKVDVDSPDLQRLHEKIAAALPNTDTHPEYQPHATLAYVKPGLGAQYEGNAALEGRQAVVDSLSLMTRDGREVKIPLGGKVAEPAVAAQEAVQAAPGAGVTEPPTAPEIPQQEPIPAAAAPVQEPSPKLPRDLAGAAPRYRDKQLQFDSDVDRARYILAQDKPSARDADYLRFAQDATGLDERTLRAQGRGIREGLKPAYAAAGEEETLRVRPSGPASFRAGVEAIPDATGKLAHLPAPVPGDTLESGRTPEPPSPNPLPGDLGTLEEQAVAQKLRTGFEQGGGDVTAGLTARPGATGPGMQDVGVNLGRVDTTPEVKGQMAGLAKTLNPYLSRSTPLSNAEVRAGSETILSKVTPQELITDIRDRQSDQVTPQERDALRRVSVAYSERASASLARLRAAESSGQPAATIRELEADYREHNLQAATALALSTEGSTQIGRAMQALRMSVSGADLPENQRTLQDITTMLRKAGADPKEAARLNELWNRDPFAFVKDPAVQHNRSMMDRIVDFNRASLLTAISGTRVLGGNSTMAMVELWRSGAGGVIRGLLGDLDTRGRYPSDIAATWTGMMEALPEALSRLKGDIGAALTGKPIVDPNALPSETLHNQPPFYPGTKLAELHYAPMKIVAAGDMVMRPLFARGELHRLAAVDARQAGLNPRTPEFQAHQEKFIEAFNNGEKPAVSRHLAAFASHSVMGGDLGTFGKATTQLLANLPLLKLDIPFVRSAFNIGDVAIDLSPAGTLRALWKGSKLREKVQGMRDLPPTEGKWSKDEIAGRLAMSLLGTTIAGGLIVPAAAMGLITGSGPADPKEHKAWLDLGNKPYSFMGVTGLTESVEPLGNVLRMAADYAEILSGKKGGDSSTYAQLVAATRDGLGSYRFVNNLMLLLKAVSDPNQGLQPYVAQHAGQLMPATIRNVAQAIDPVIRDTRDKTITGTLIKPIKAATPGLSQTLPAKRTLAGEESTREPGVVAGVARVLSPIQYTSPATGPSAVAEKEMTRVGYFPSMPKQSIRLAGGQTMNLSDSEFQTLLDAHKAAAGDVQKLMQAPEYRSLPDTIAEGGSRSKEAMIRKVYDRRRDSARQQVYARLRIRTKRARGGGKTKAAGTGGTGGKGGAAKPVIGL